MLECPEIPLRSALIESLDESTLFVEEDSYGIEDEPHITLLYGIHDNELKIEKIYEFLKSLKQIPLTLNKISSFNNDRFDVLKFEVELSKELKAYRKRAELILPNTQTYPDYNPHMTIAYMQPKSSIKFHQILDPIQIYPTGLKYSRPDGSSFTIKY